MRLAWRREPDTDWRTCDVCGPRPCGLHSHIASSQSVRRMFDDSSRPRVPLIGPRVRLPQAKDVPEQVILEVLGRRPGVWHTHWPITSYALLANGRRGEVTMPSIPHLAPELAAFPEKVVWAKLCSMERRGLIRGYGGFRSRGDWHVPGPR